MENTGCQTLCLPSGMPTSASEDTEALPRCYRGDMETVDAGRPLTSPPPPFSPQHMSYF